MNDNLIFLNLTKVNYRERLSGSIRNLIRKPTVLLLMIVFIVLILISVFKQSNLLLIVLLLNLIVFFIPIFFFECKNYINEIRICDDKLEIHYQFFFKSSVIIEQFDNIRIIEYAHTPGSITVNNFKIYRDFGKGHRKTLINQYEILEWSNNENKDKLKNILNKS